MKLKKWVESLLIFMNCLLLLFLASDTESTKIFISSHLVALIMFILNVIILTKYGRLMED